MDRAEDLLAFAVRIAVDPRLRIDADGELADVTGIFVPLALDHLAQGRRRRAALDALADALLEGPHDRLVDIADALHPAIDDDGALDQFLDRARMAFAVREHAPAFPLPAAAAGNDAVADTDRPILDAERDVHAELAGHTDLRGLLHAAAEFLADRPDLLGIGGRRAANEDFLADVRQAEIAGVSLSRASWIALV